MLAYRIKPERNEVKRTTAGKRPASLGEVGNDPNQPDSG